MSEIATVETCRNCEDSRPQDIMQCRDCHLHLEGLSYPPIRNMQSLYGCLTLKPCKEVQ